MGGTALLRAFSRRRPHALRLIRCLVCVLSLFARFAGRRLVSSCQVTSTYYNLALSQDGSASIRQHCGDGGGGVHRLMLSTTINFLRFVHSRVSGALRAAASRASLLPDGLVAELHSRGRRGGGGGGGCVLVAVVCPLRGGGHHVPGLPHVHAVRRLLRLKWGLAQARTQLLVEGAHRKVEDAAQHAACATKAPTRQISRVALLGRVAGRRRCAPRTANEPPQSWGCHDDPPRAPKRTTFAPRVDHRATDATKP